MSFCCGAVRETVRATSASSVLTTRLMYSSDSPTPRASAVASDVESSRNRSSSPESSCANACEPTERGTEHSTR